MRCNKSQSLELPRLLCTTAAKLSNRNSPPQTLLKSQDVVNESIRSQGRGGILSKLKISTVMLCILMDCIYEA